MGVSPRRSLFHRKLYRKGMLAVTLAATICFSSPWLVAQILAPTYGRKTPVDKGPRALGLVQLAPKGKKARFTPIAIMMDGKFYDAGAFKANPVPLALDYGNVYEAFRGGVSQGIFTITQPGQLNHVWIAEGTWIPAGERVLEKRKKYSTPVIADDDRNGPPVLHRRQPADSDNSSDSGRDTNKDKKDQQKPATTSTSPPTTNSPTPTPSAGTPTAPDATKTPASPEPAKPAAPSRSVSDEPIEDPNRPRLRREKPDPSEHHDSFTTFDAVSDTTASAATAAASSSAGKGATTKNTAAPPPIVIPAISDAGGPDPRPYTYDLKPAEEAIYRNKMIDLATTQLQARAKAAAKEAMPANRRSSASKSSSKSKSDTEPPKPTFDDVSLRIFDLSNSNEPVLVLSAKTQPPAASRTESSSEPKQMEPQEITLIARTNLEGELQKLFFSQTDSHHLDISPRMELIDAVDADGDGRGELLFRRTFDDGSAYAIYRVTADQLWPLFEGTP
jgi:hypothetical protein